MNFEEENEYLGKLTEDMQLSYEMLNWIKNIHNEKYSIERIRNCMEVCLTILPDKEDSKELDQC